MNLLLHPEIQQYFSNDNNLFDQIMALQGEVYRELENRRTQKITLGEKNYFIKQHFGIGWKEIFKNLFQLRLPILSAKNEWQAIQHLQPLHIMTQKIMGYGIRGSNPAHIQSFLITEELPTQISLENLTQHKKLSFCLKRQLTQEIARIARTLHQHGINHRDFYLCHFLLAEKETANKLYLIDLHRAQIRKKTPERWIIKDLAGLYFSSYTIGLTTRDYLRFIKHYYDKPLHEIFNNKEIAFWQKVKQRGNKLYKRHAS